MIARNGMTPISEEWRQWARVLATKFTDISLEVNYEMCWSEKLAEPGAGDLQKIWPNLLLTARIS